MKTSIYGYLAAVILLLSCVPMALAKDQQNELQVHFEAGQQLLQDGEYEGAIKEYQQALVLAESARSGDGDKAIIEKNIRAINYYLGFCYYSKGDADQAIASYSKALGVGYEKAYRERGLSYLLKHDVDKAIADFTSGLGFGFPDAGLELGLCYVRKGDLDLAIQAFTDSERLLRKQLSSTPANTIGTGNISSEDQSLLFNLSFQRGDCFLNQDEFLKAIGDFTIAISHFRDDDDDPYQKRGYCYFKTGDFDRAIVDLTEAIKRRPKIETNYITRGQCFGEKGNTDKEMADYTKAIELAPNEVAAFLARSTAYERHGDASKAIADYTTATALAPRRAATYYNRGMCYKEQGNFNNAIADFTQAISVALDPIGLKALEARASCYEASGASDKAAVDRTQVTKLTDTADIYRRAQDMVAAGDLRGANGLFSWVIEIKPGMTEAYMARAGCLVKQGSIYRAARDYTKVIQLNPAFGAAYLERGELNQQRKLYQQALVDYTKCIELEPKNDKAYTARATAYDALGDASSSKTDKQRAVELQEQ
jgi:tetratricopeptide (TPR) repeat protein